jgi:hypothetical protein
MKKRFVMVATVLALTVGTIAGCGGAQEATQENVQTESVQETAPAAETENSTQTAEIANPWVDITEEEANELCFRLFKAPEGATVKGWSKCESLADPDKAVGPLVQLSFTMEGTEFVARAQQGASEDADIAGLYYEWTVGPEDVTLANWGGGNMTGKTYRYVGDAEFVDLLTWYDIEIGIAYSLTASDKDLDGFDIQGVVEQMYAGENEAFADMPEDFLQEQSGITSFASFDEVIAALQQGQGYAYIKLMGCDEDILAVTDLVFEADHSAYEASLYKMEDGKAKMIGLASGNGSAFPLRYADGILYGGHNHLYETYVISQEFGSLMMMDYIDDGVASGSNEFSGFTRKENRLDVEAQDFTGTEEDFQKLLADRETKPIVEFTVVK